MEAKSQMTDCAGPGHMNFRWLRSLSCALTGKKVMVHPALRPVLPAAARRMPPQAWSYQPQALRTKRFDERGVHIQLPELFQLLLLEFSLSSHPRRTREGKPVSWGIQERSSGPTSGCYPSAQVHPVECPHGEVVLKQLLVENHVRTSHTGKASYCRQKKRTEDTSAQPGGEGGSWVILLAWWKGRHGEKYDIMPSNGTSLHPFVACLP